MQPNQNFLDTVHGYNDEAHEAEQKPYQSVPSEVVKPSKEFLHSLSGYNDVITESM